MRDIVGVSNDMRCARFLIPDQTGYFRLKHPQQQERHRTEGSTLTPNDASAPTASQKTGSEIETSASDGVRVPNDTAADFPLTKQGAEDEGAA